MPNLCSEVLWRSGIGVEHVSPQLCSLPTPTILLLYSFLPPPSSHYLFFCCCSCSLFVLLFLFHLLLLIFISFFPFRTLLIFINFVMIVFLFSFICFVPHMHHSVYSSFNYMFTSIMYDKCDKWFIAAFDIFSEPVTIQFSLILLAMHRYLECSITSVQYGRIQNARMMLKYSSKNIKAAMNIYTWQQLRVVVYREHWRVSTFHCILYWRFYG